MSVLPSSSEPSESDRAAARDWVVAFERGLSAQEEAELHCWLAENPRHAIAWEECSTLLDRLDRLTVSRAIAAPARVGASWRRWVPALAVAALVVVALVIGLHSNQAAGELVSATVAPGSALEAKRAMPSKVGDRVRTAPVFEGLVTPAAASPGGEVRRLSDGTTVFLKPGAEFREQFSNNFRLGTLLSGEAMFDVVSDSADRPFVLIIGGSPLHDAGAVALTIRSAWFGVSLQEGMVETRVLMGQVMVSPTAADAAEIRNGRKPGGLLTEAGLIARIEYPAEIDSVPHILPLAPSVLQQHLAWKRSMEAAVVPASLPPK